MNYYNVIELIKSYWQEELEDIYSPFYKDSKIEIEAKSYFKRWGKNIENILFSMKQSVLEKQKWYYTEQKLADHFKTSKRRIRESLKSVCQNLEMVLIKLPSRSNIDSKGKRQRPIWRFFLIPPNLTKVLRATSNFPIDQFRFKFLLPMKSDICAERGGLCAERGGLCAERGGINPPDQDSCGFAAPPSYLVTNNNQLAITLLLSTNCFAVSFRRRIITSKNAKRRFCSIPPSIDNQKPTISLAINKEQTVKSKRLQLKSTHVDSTISLPSQRALGEKKEIVTTRDLHPVKLKLQIKNIDSQTMLTPQKPLENETSIEPKKSPFRTPKELLSANEQIKAKKMLVKEKLTLQNNSSHGDLVKKVTKVSAKDYDIDKGKVYTVNNHFGVWILETLDWVIDCNVPPISNEQVQKFIDCWNSMDNPKFIDKFLKIGSKNFNYLRLALTFRLANHELTFNECLSAVSTYSQLLKYKQLKHKLKKVDPLQHFLYNSPRSKNWFEICIKPQFEAAREVHVKTTEWTLSFDRVLNLFAKHFYGGNRVLADREVTRYYPEYIDWINFLVSEHRNHCIGGGIKFESFLESFFEFLSKFKKGPKFRPSLKLLTDPITLNHYYAQMIEETGNSDYVLPWAIVKERKRKQEEIQTEYDRLNPKN